MRAILLTLTLLLVAVSVASIPERLEKCLPDCTGVSLPHGANLNRADLDDATLSYTRLAQLEQFLT